MNVTFRMWTNDFFNLKNMILIMRYINSWFEILQLKWTYGMNTGWILNTGSKLRDAGLVMPSRDAFKQGDIKYEVRNSKKISIQT